MSCKTCRLARWEFTPSGQIKRKVAGRCMAEPQVIAPACAEVRVFKGSIWPDDGKDCPMFSQMIGKEV